MIGDIIDNDILNKFENEFKNDRILNALENAIQKNGFFTDEIK